MVSTATLSAVNQLKADTSLKLDTTEFLTLMQSLGVLPEEEQKQVTWAAIGMAVANAGNNTTGGKT